MRHHKLKKGFTLIELMIVVAIIGILAAVAIPAFLKYIRRSHTSEALTMLRKIHDGQVSYYMVDHVNQLGARLPAQFLSAGPEPATIPSNTRTQANWTDVGWLELKVAPDAPVRYRYTSVAAGLETTSSFTARAEGDLDGDGFTSLFERPGRIISSSGEILGGPGVYQKDPLE